MRRRNATNGDTLRKRLEGIRESVGPGRPRLERPTRAALEALYVRGRLSLRDTAAALGIGKDTAAAALAEYGIARRPKTTKRGVLADIPLELLEANVQAGGLKAHARTLGVAPSTLRAHIRRAKGGLK
jgi:hypothetical protein